MPPLMKVKSIMHDITVISDQRKVIDAVQIMAEKDIGSILIEKNGEICGILTERDVLKKIVADMRDPGSVTVGQLMSTSLQSIDANATVLDASEMLSKHKIRRLPVKENGKIVGMVTARNVGQHVHEYYKAIAEKYLIKLIEKMGEEESKA
jgi:signal-transduction protein with cAMP-binding, CBS, and nucleotidyltransferase domain